ncbi:hypothetical protein MKX08_003334 [Trichoderma sp. CBMAI-0020]|nr:hypothetical protein MKX08_003334 [Trichoderma sp. CBMAI-0020]
MTLEDLYALTATSPRRSRPFKKRLLLLQPILTQMPKSAANAYNNTQGFHREVWANILAPYGLGGEASISGKRSENDTYKFDSVDTQYFYPSPSYISQCMGLFDVKEYTEVTKYKKAVYLVTGLKVAKGASVRLAADNEIKGKLDVGLNDPTLIPVQLGPRAEGSVENKLVDNFKESSDIVVGIQCLKIYYQSSFFGSGKQMKDAVYADGATFLGDEAKKQEVPFEDLVFAAPEDYDNSKFSAHYQVMGEGQDNEIWILPAGLV